MLEYFGELIVEGEYQERTQQNVGGRLVTTYTTLSEVDIITPQYARPNDKEYLEEGVVLRNHSVVWLESPPQVVRNSLDSNPNEGSTRLVYNGDTYEITSNNYRSEGDFYRLILKMINRGTL